MKKSEAKYKVQITLMGSEDNTYYRPMWISSEEYGFLRRLMDVKPQKDIYGDYSPGIRFEVLEKL